MNNQEQGASCDQKKEMLEKEKLLLMERSQRVKAFCRQFELAGIKPSDIWCGGRFDPVAMRKLLTSKLSADEIIFLCKVGVKGNNVDRMISMSYGEERTRLSNLKERIKIEAKAMRNPDTVTLSRILACFPDTVVDIVSTSDPKMIVPYRELKKIHAEFPAIARAQVGSSVLPRSLNCKEMRLALALFLVSSVKTSEIISARDANWTQMTDERKAEYTFEYICNYCEYKVLSEAERTEISLRYGIVRREGDALALAAPWAAAGAAAVAWLEGHYSFDMNKENLRGLRLLYLRS